MIFISNQSGYLFTIRVFISNKSGNLFPIRVFIYLQGIYFQSIRIFISHQGIYLCRGDPEHPGCEAMHQPRLFLNRSRVLLEEREKQELPPVGVEMTDTGKPHQPSLEHLFCQTKPTRRVSVPSVLCNPCQGSPASLRACSPHQPLFLSSSCRSILASSLLSQESSPESVQTTTRSTGMPMPSSKFFSLEF